MQNINEILEKDPLVELIQPDQFVGWTYRIDYETAIVLTNDLWKSRARGVPHNCFLLATSIDPKKFAESKQAAREVVLLRVIGASPLPMDDKLINAKIENLKDRTSSTAGRELDDLTKSELQFGGLECRILGTFFTHDGKLRLGSDVESYLTAAQFNVFRPTGAALETIVNYISPERLNAAKEEGERLGLKDSLPQFPIGTVRYTSTDRLHRADAMDRVVFKLNAIDFLARRTAVFGMTRTGKSNMVKQLVSVVMRTSAKCGLKIGQIIYDLNGEYANANQQDKGSIAEVYPNETVRYRMLLAEGFQPILNNFFLQVAEGYTVLRSVLKEINRSSAADMDTFFSLSLDKPADEEFDLRQRWEVKIAAYQCLLARAGFAPPKGFRVRFQANEDVRKQVDDSVDPKAGLSLEDAIDWFLKAREVRGNLKSSKGKKLWLDEDSCSILNLLAQKNNNDSYITGYKLLQPAIAYHSPTRNTDVSEEIYQHLVAGKIVILDLSVGDPAQRERLGKRIAQHIFQSSMATFNSGKHPPHIVIYIEEAHNVIGRNEELTETWPRIAKEGAKARIATVYATQEVSSIHPNILSNTENILVSHLNNENEMRELSKFYDFRDFSNSIMRAQDVGFDRVKTLSNPFVIPVQIDLFDPEAEKRRSAQVK